MMMAGQCPPHVVGRNSAAPFPAKAENSAQAPFLHLRPKSRPSGGWPPKRACGRSPLPTGPASLGSGGGLSFSERRKRENPPEGPLAASRLTLAGRARSTAQPLAALPLRAAASPSRGKEKKTFWSLRKPFASIEGRAADLMGRRRDFLLFPRFAPDLYRAGRFSPLTAAFFR